MTAAMTRPTPIMRPITFQYPFVASQASFRRPRAAHAASGMGANRTAMPAISSRKDFMDGGWWPALISGIQLGISLVFGPSWTASPRASACAFTNERTIA